MAGHRHRRAPASLPKTRPTPGHPAARWSRLSRSGGGERSEPFSMPDHLKRTGLAEVASELALGETETALTLAAKRRRFAAANHPDRLPWKRGSMRPCALKLANMLIDEALRRIEGRKVTG